MKIICGMKRSLESGMDESLSGWYGRVECMADCGMVKIYNNGVDGTGRRSRPRKRWIDERENEK